MLRVEDLHVSYGHVRALLGVSLSVKRGAIVSIIGSNGAGKSTLLNTVSGLVKRESGKIFFKTKLLPKEPHRIVKGGLVQVPEGRQVFPGLTVRENLLAGAYPLSDAGRVRRNLDRMFDMYPILRERGNQQAGTLSGGEQQMLAICRGLMSDPEMLLLDEPSLGLAPLIVKGIFEAIKKLNKEEGLTVFLVEQNAFAALKLSDRAYVMVNGLVTMSGTGKELLADPSVRAAYLEGGHH